MSQGIDPDSVEKSMYDVLVHHHPIRDVIRKREVDVACSSIDLAGAERAHEHADRSGAVTSESPEDGRDGLRLRLHRYASVTGPSHGQRLDSRQQSYRAVPV